MHVARQSIDVVARTCKKARIGKHLTLARLRVVHIYIPACSHVLIPYDAGESMGDSTNHPSAPVVAAEPENNQAEEVAEHTKGAAEQPTEQADGVAKPALEWCGSSD